MSSRSTVITQAVVDAALQRAREERALAFRAVFAALAAAFRRPAGPVRALPAAAH